MNLISADKALEQASAFDLSQEQIIEGIAHLIDANSKAGSRFINVQYLTSAVSRHELDGALTVIRNNGYATEVIEAATDHEKWSVKISW